jgi:hypothetical protein
MSFKFLTAEKMLLFIPEDGGSIFSERWCEYPQIHKALLPSSPKSTPAVFSPKHATYLRFPTFWKMFGNLMLCPA